ncbi:MAG: putative diguanylate cyclase (GGDEF)/phosphodiesterase [Hyphomicrobiales bacterium]|nr:putative diguanylate cyclase (GGDEF)/phosphodiesterase [Hyphomicrobiales bacterium]
MTTLALTRFANWSWRRASISSRLYLYLLLSLCAITALSGASIYFSKHTEYAAQRLYEDGFVGVLSSARLEMLLEQHGRIIESLPSQMDRAELQRKEASIDAIEGKLRDLLSASEIGEAATDDPQVRISLILPALFNAADDVFFFAREFAQDKAAEEVETYNKVAARLKQLTLRYRDVRLQEAKASIDNVTNTVGSLIAWVVVCAACATLLVGPLGLATMQRVLYRLRQITAAMTRLASNDTSVRVPYQQDTDEVGAMARAIAVFKANAIQLTCREAELQALNGRLDVAMNNMTHGLCMFDSDARLIICNKAYAHMYALPEALTRPGATWDAIMEHRIAAGSGGAAGAHVVRPDPSFGVVTIGRKLADGREISVTQSPMPGNGWVAVHEDVTVRRRAEAEVLHLARHDALTCLPNRLYFREFLTDSVARAGAKNGCALHCIDLDQFKNVNDTLGHPVGDELLKQVAARLSEVTRPQDLIARLGGDEFAVVQSDVADVTQCEALAQRLIEAVSEPYLIDGRLITIGASVGLAMAPFDGGDPDQLLKNADMALYEAKSQGRGVHCFYSPAMGAQLSDRVDLENELREAMAQEQLSLHYQPIVCLATGRVKSLEALLRWRSPQRGWVAPSDIIPVAEQCGLINPLGEWILRRATADAAQWPGDVSLAVNLSAAQFKGSNLLELTRSALEDSSFPASRLHVEVTESALLQDEGQAFEVLESLREIGVRISLDDFGTGYSSLSHLRTFRFDKIKIDRSFVSEIVTREDCRAIVRAVTSMAQSLGVETTAEGIETQPQLDAARAEQCSEGQGYLFSRPMAAADVAPFLSAHALETTGAGEPRGKTAAA